MREDPWADHAKALLKSELKRKNVSYRDLAERLTAMGIPESRAEYREQDQSGRLYGRFLVAVFRGDWLSGRSLGGIPTTNALSEYTPADNRFVVHFALQEHVNDTM